MQAMKKNKTHIKVLAKIARKVSGIKFIMTLMSDGGVWERYITKKHGVKTKGNWKYVDRWMNVSPSIAKAQFLKLFLGNGWKKK